MTNVGAWHPGEVALQRLVGSEDRLASHAARILLPYLTEQLRAFFPQLPFVAVGFVDDTMYPWGTLLSGNPGFVWSPEPTLLRVDRVPPTGDPLADVLRPGASLGLLGIELPSRRRNRVNGMVMDRDASGFTLQVEQAFGNCPKYIQQRAYRPRNLSPVNAAAIAFDNLDNTRARQLLSNADTMFVATYAPGPTDRPAVDISHRGGRPGFIRVDADGALTIPDFAGNRYFNTLGNIAQTSRAALVVPCFEKGDLLLLTGDANLQLQQRATEEEYAFPGAERFWQMRPRNGRWLLGALPLGYQFTSWSTHTLATGVWSDPNHL